MTAREGRAFAFPVGAAFLVLAGITWWRDHALLTQIFGGLGGVLLAAGLVAPTALGPVQRVWMGLAHAISRVTTPIFMGIVYFLVLTPIGILRRLLGSNPVKHPAVDGSYWHTRPEKRRRGNLHRQF
ncbi:MAG: hypothetical protein HKN71_01005 [Gemmatimonadetes bacterium]|nr:hypothetical protein [Gemmatimonadota bacterium]